MHGAVEIGGKHRVRNRHVEDRLQPAGEDSAELGESGAAERQGKRVLGLGGGALGSEGYGEATMGSVHRIGLALQFERMGAIGVERGDKTLILPFDLAWAGK